MKELLAAAFSGVAIASVAAIPGYASAMPDGFPDPAQFTETAVAPVGQKVTIGPTVCMIGENRLTACTDGESGFVIEPSGSWGF